jgi:hypothetical protein
LTINELNDLVQKKKQGSKYKHNKNMVLKLCK